VRPPLKPAGVTASDDGWHPQTLRRQLHSLTAPIFGRQTTAAGHPFPAQARADLEQFIFYVVMLSAPAQMRLAVAEYLAIANHGLRIGNFEMGF